MTDTTPNNDKWLRLAREAHSASTSYFDTSIRAQIEADIRQYNGVHPKGSKYLHDAYKSRSRFFRPKTRSAIRKKEAIAAEAFFSTSDVLSLKPEDEGSALGLASAELLKHLVQYRLTKSIPWFQILMGAYQDAQVTGIVVGYNYWDYSEKRKIDKPCIDLVPIENFRFDPNATWHDPIGTSPYLIHLIPMYVKDVKARMKKAEGEEGKWFDVTDAELLVAKNSSTDTTRLERENGRVDPRQETTAVTDYTIVWVHRNIVEEDGEDWVYYTLGVHKRLSEPQRLADVYWHGKRPYVMGQCMIETHRLYPSSVPRISRDSQGIINEQANQRIDNVRFAMNKRYFAKRGAQVDVRSLTRNAVSSVTLMNDPEKDVKVVETNDVTGSAYAEQDRLNLDFDELVGGFSGSSVQSNRQLNETVGGMNILSRTANQVDQYQLMTFTKSWVEPELRQLIMLEQHYETDEVVLALAGRRAKLFEAFKIMQINDALIMQELVLSVSVGMGATNPQDRINMLLAAFNAVKEVLDGGLIERYGGNVLELIKEIFGAAGYQDGARFFPHMEEEDPVVSGLKDQLAKVQQALDSKWPPELVEAQVKKALAEAEKIIADKVRIGVESSFSAMQAAQVIAATPATAPIADIVMKSAGYTPPTPPGVDPNFPQPGAASTDGLTQDMIKQPKTGIKYLPQQNTNPLTPANPATGADGLKQGIETPAADSVAAA
jgi:hypothetical protein